MEDVVRQVIINEQTEYEATILPKYEDESYLQLYHQHKMLRKPLQFDQLVGKNLQYVVEGEEEDKTKVLVSQHKMVQEAVIRLHTSIRTLLSVCFWTWMRE